MHYIGKIDKSKIGLYSEKIKTEMVVLTDERKQHIYQSHPKDYKKIIENIDRIVLNPDEVIQDMKNKDTIFLIGRLERDNLNVIVRLNTNNSKQHPQNSVMSAWIIRNSNLIKLRQKNKTIYKSV
ncbi:MAG: hypothetical protein HFJ58_05165 [Clostridia bacterium]|nr:hypothetical protein [Clostridia bacterium]